MEYHTAVQMNELQPNKTIWAFKNIMLSEKKQISEYYVQYFICIKLKKNKNNILIMLKCDETVFISNGMINTKFKKLVSSGEK